VVKLSSGFITKLLVGVEDDEGLGTGLNTGAGHVVTQTASTSTAKSVNG
jgi:hypothetical protein